MLVVMKAQATEEQIQAVCDHILALGYRPHPMPGAQRTAIVSTPSIVRAPPTLRKPPSDPLNVTQVTPKSAASQPR